MDTLVEEKRSSATVPHRTPGHARASHRHHAPSKPLPTIPPQVSSALSRSGSAAARLRPEDLLVMQGLAGNAATTALVEDLDGDEGQVLNRKSRVLRRKKEVTETLDGYNRAITDYTMRAGRGYVVVQQQTEMLEADYRSLEAHALEYLKREGEAERSEAGSKEQVKLWAECDKILEIYAKDLASAGKAPTVSTKVDEVIAAPVERDGRSRWQKLSEAAGRGGQKLKQAISQSPQAVAHGTVAGAKAVGRASSSGAKKLKDGVKRAGQRLTGTGPHHAHDPEGWEKLHGALLRARGRWRRARVSMEAVIADRALIEDNADRAQALRNAGTIAALQSTVRRRQGREPDPVATDGAEGLDALRDLAFDSAHHLQDISQHRNLVKADFEFVKKDLDRFPGAIRKTVWGGAAGAASAVTGIATMGLLGMEARTDEQGRVQAWKGWFPFKVTFLNNVAKRVDQFFSESALRAGKFVWDRVSALFGLFNEAVLQNMVNIFGTLGTWVSVVGAAAALAGAVGFGVGALPGALILHLGLAIGAVALVASVLKALINSFRTQAAFVVALWNQDAKVQNQLNARVIGTGIQTAGDVTQALAKGVSVTGMGLDVGGVTSGLTGTASHLYDAGKYSLEVGVDAGKIAVADILPPLYGAFDDRQSAYDNTGPGLNRLHPATAAKTQREQLRVHAALRRRMGKLKADAQPVNTRVKELSLKVQAAFAPLVRLKDAFKKMAAKVGGWFKKDTATEEVTHPDEAAEATTSLTGLLHQVLDANKLVEEELQHAVG